MNILILYHPETQTLRTIYDIEQKYDRTNDGDRLDSGEYVVDQPGSVPEGNRMLREERAWLLKQGKGYAAAGTMPTEP